MADYPDNGEIPKIKRWKFNTPTSFVEFMRFVQLSGCYWPENVAWKQRGRTYSISTGGWSGNEEILQAMRDNFIFWAVCWVKSERGGHYTFKLPNPKTYFVSSGSHVIKDTP